MKEKYPNWKVGISLYHTTDSFNNNVTWDIMPEMTQYFGTKQEFTKTDRRHYTHIGPGSWLFHSDWFDPEDHQVEDWYKENIDESVRPLVKLLRDTGFNTECSCGNQMYIQCQYPKSDSGELTRLDNLLFNNGYRDYKIEVEIKRIDGHRYDSLYIRINRF